jgi:hypothetical protein
MTNAIDVHIIVRASTMDAQEIAMRTQELIRTSRGTEVPAAGDWRIPRSHVTVTYTARTGLGRRVQARAPSASGVVRLTDDLADATLELIIDAAATSVPSNAPSLGSLLGNEDLRHVVLRAGGIELMPDGRWSMRGEIRIGRSTVPAPVVVTYHGVFRFGDDAKARISVRSDIRRPDVTARRPVTLVADVLAVCPRQAARSSATCAD